MLTRNDKPAASVVPVRDLEKLECQEDEQDVADSFKALQEPQVSWEDLKRELKLPRSRKKWRERSGLNGDKAD